MKAPRRSTVNLGGRPRLSEIEGRQRHLLEVATAIFIADGYAGTSIERIATVAKASKTTIYARYGDKAGLFKAVVDHVLKHKTTPINRPIAAKTGIAALKEQLANNISASLQADYVGLFRLFLSEARRFPEIVDVFPARGDAYRLLVEQLQEHPEFAEFLPFKDEIAHMLVSMTGILVTTSAVLADFAENLDSEAEASRLVDICLYGFFGRCARADGSPA